MRQPEVAQAVPLSEPSPPPATLCHRVVRDCQAQRLANIILTGHQTSGALGPVDGFDLDRIISFDEALRRALHEDGVLGGKEATVQVILGSADASKLRWGKGVHLYYAVD